MPQERFQPGKHITIVYEHLLLGETNKEIARSTNLSLRQVSRQKAFLRGVYGVLPDSTTEETKRNLRDSHDSVYLRTELFERMGMTTTEQIEAVKQKYGVVLRKRAVLMAGNRARNAEDRPKQLGKSIAGGARDARWFKHQTPERVRFWSAASDFLDENNVEDRPASREDWFILGFAARLSELGYVDRSIEAWQGIAELYKKNNRTLPPGWPGMDLDQELKFLNGLENASVGPNEILLEIFDQDRSLLPENPLYRHFLAEYTLALQAKQETGDSSEVNRVLQTYWEKDPWIIDRLSGQMQRISKKINK